MTTAAADATTRVHARGTTRPRLAPVIASTGVVAAATAIAWVRLPAVARDTLWAEDGRTFLTTAAGSDGWGTILRPYMGYLHVVPRILALATVDAVPVSGWALSMTFLSCLVAGAVAGIVFVTSRAHVRWMPARLLLAGLTVLTPLASREVLGDAANLHSLLLWGAFWMVLARPTTRTEVWILTGAMLLSSSTEIQTVFLVPLVLVRRRDRSTWPIKAALLVGVVAQLMTTLVDPRQHGDATPDSPASIALGWVINAVVTSWMPRGAVGGVVAQLGWGSALLLVIPLLSIAVALVLGRRESRLPVLALVGGALVVWTASVTLNPAPFFQYATTYSSGQVWLSRYGVIPAMMLLAVTVIAIDALATRRSSGRRVATVVAAALTIVLALQAVPATTRRSAGPEWQPQIAAARSRCGEHGGAVSLRETLGWLVTVPCQYLDDGDGP